MIVYRVELEMATALRAEYLPWLRAHVAEMLALPGFIAAEILLRGEPPAAPGCCVCVVDYRLRDRAAWEDYLRLHAPSMRAAGRERFGTRVRASRQLLEVA